MRILMVTAGSTGDVLPYTGLGVRLSEAGHEVVLATHERFAATVSDRGLGFRSLPVDPFTELSSAGGRRLVRASSGPLAMAQLMSMGRSFMPELGRGVLAAVERGADVLLLSTTAARLGHLVARALDVPSMGVFLQPWSPTAEFAPAVLGARSLGRWGNRAAGRAALALIDRMYAESVRDLRALLGLPRRADSSSLRRETEGWPVGYAYSPAVLPRPADWRPEAQVVGYLWPSRPRDWRPPAELTDFLAAGPPPVYVGFGSAVAPDPEALSRLAVRALRSAGLRGVLQSGWSGLQADGDDILTIGEVPHDWLFPRMAALVHACGAGTTAAGLRAGVPCVPVPVQLDQPFWAHRLTALGVAPGPIPFRHLTPHRLAAALRHTTRTPAYRARARALAHRLSTEDATPRILSVIDDLTTRAGRPTRH
ncbi:glycosyltransferase [Streptomyces sp. CC228A]|uniref:glycosyltransferase n=1 Tax=Streptomyces sp. CC228A TaxID=2898186 RepID=UPI001F1811C3|nr:glycosyltransferase [Streptomyces sp. CC228A]